MTAHGDQVRCHCGAGPFFASGAPSDHRPGDADPALQQIYLRVTQPTANSEEAKGVYIDRELELIDTVQWFPKIMRKDYTVGLAVMANGLDDPDQTLYEYFVCGAEGNTDGYCSPQLDQLIDEQSREFDREKRKQLVWAIERRLAQDVARPVLYHIRAGSLMSEGSI